MTIHVGPDAQEFLKDLDRFSDDCSWYKLPDEPMESYDTFIDFLLLGYGRKLVTLQTCLSISSQTLESWAEKYRWNERSQDWDHAIARRESAMWLERKREAREQAWQDAEFLRKKAMEIVEQLPEYRTVKRKLIPGETQQIMGVSGKLYTIQRTPDVEVVTEAVPTKLAIEALKLARDLKRGVLFPKKHSSRKRGTRRQKGFSTVRQRVRYALIDPRNGEPFYVGHTVDLEGRFQSHILSGQIALDMNRPREGLTAKEGYIAALLEKGIEPEVLVLDESRCTASESRLREREWCERLARTGSILLNAEAYDLMPEYIVGG